MADRLDRGYCQVDAETAVSGRCFAVRGDKKILGADAGDDLVLVDEFGHRCAVRLAGDEGAAIGVPTGLHGQKVHAGGADEAGDEDGGRLFVDVDRRADLLDLALVHNHQAVAEGHGFELVVGDVEAGGAELSLQALDLDAHLHAELGVQIGERLVEQEGGRIADNGAAHGDALALTAGELAGLAVQEVGEFEDAGGLLDAAVDLRLRGPAFAEAVGEVVVDGHVRVERIVLEHHGDVPVRGLDVVDHAPADLDLALGDGLQARDHAQKRGLAAAARPDQDNEFAIGDVERDAFHGLHAAWISFSDLIDAEFGHDFIRSFLAFDQPFDEPALKQHDHQDRRHHRENGQREGLVEGRKPALGQHQEHLLQAHHQGEVGFLGGHDDRPEILVPADHEHDHEDRRHHGLGERHQDVDEEADRAGAVDARRFDQLVRHGLVELPEEEGRGGGRDQREDQAGVGVQEPEAGDDLVGRDDPDFERQEQRCEDQPETERGEGEAEIDDGVSGEHGDDDLADGETDAEDHRVHGHGETGDRLGETGPIGEDFGVGVQKITAPAELHAVLTDIGAFVGR